MSEQLIHGVEDLRFQFGVNWSRFLKSLNGDRIRTAEESLKADAQEQTPNGTK